ncbi:Heterokaryon incompatibility protein (HET) domain containing protein, partial [Rhypophila sp. PSN 637]
FAALSYCWGSDQPAATTLSRLEAYTKDGIPIPSLPLTGQHAITVCKALEISFLWVDSICIPQGGPAHMEHEPSIMGAIYHNAYVVISAMSAKSCNDGFLYKAPPPSGMVSKVTRKSFKLPVGTDGEVVVFLDPSSADCNFQGPKFDSEPLSKRGWAYQESFLARRILAFTTNEVIWSCRETGGDSGGAREGFDTQVLFGDFGRIAHVFVAKYRDWGFIIENFSQGLLSKDADKFFALAGVAELFHQQNGGNYVAGLWIEAGYQLLAWFVPHSDDSDPPTRPSAWRAPSWSYMSLDSPVSIRFNSISYWLVSNGKLGSERNRCPSRTHSGDWSRLVYRLPGSWCRCRLEV